MSTLIDHDAEANLARGAETVARAGRRLNAPLAAYLCLTIGLVVAGAYLWAHYRNEQRSMTDRDANETFRTAQTRGDLAFQEKPPGRSEARLVIPPPPAAPAQAPAVTPTPVTVAQPSDDSEARRLAAEEAERMRRLRSPMMVLDGGDKNAPAQSEVAKVMASGPEEDANRRFANQVSNTGVEISKAEKIQRIDALIPQGTMIRGVLETAIQSDLPGMVRGVTSEDVYSFDGRRILIPRGTMLTGEYRSGLARGQTRVLIIWTRVLRSDGVSLALGSYGTDDLGRSGLTGDVDRHYLERFGSAILLSIVGGGSQYLAGLGQNTNQNEQTQTSYTDPVTGKVVTVTSQPSYSQNNARQIGAQQAANAMNQIASEAFKDSVNIPPTIYVDQGTPIIVFVRRDLDFSSLYTDPVKEALIALKHPGRPVPGQEPPPAVIAGPVYKP